MHGHDFFILPYRYVISYNSILLRLTHNKLVKFETLRSTSYHLILIKPENIRYGVTDIQKSLLHVNQIIIDVCIICYRRTCHTRTRSCRIFHRGIPT